MAGSLQFLRYQQVAHWRRAFSVRSQHDKLSFFLVLIVLIGAYRLILLLNTAASELQTGKTEVWAAIAAIVFFVWAIPAVECQALAAKTDDFYFLPINKRRFALINISNTFLVPTAVIALLISVAAIYPLLFSLHPVVGSLGLFLYCFLAAFAWTAFFRLLKIGSFRVLIFVAALSLAIFLVRQSQAFSVSELISIAPIVQIASGEEVYKNLTLLVAAVAAAFLVLLIVMTSSTSSRSVRNRRSPGILSRIRIPLHLGESIKKDLFFAWKTPDCYLSLLVCTIYAIILVQVDFSFVSFSVAITLSVMLSTTLAFNIFGLETPAGFQRLTLAPIKPADLLKAKNKAFFLLVFTQSFFLLPLVLYKFGVLWLFIAGIKTTSICLLCFAFGNHLSMRFPFKMRFYEFSIGGSIPAALLGIASVSIVCNLPDIVSRGHVTIALIGNVILLPLSYLVYKFSLDRASKELPGYWEDIGRQLA